MQLTLSRTFFSQFGVLTSTQHKLTYINRYILNYTNHSRLSKDALIYAYQQRLSMRLSRHIWTLHYRQGNIYLHLQLEDVYILIFITTSTLTLNN